MSTARDVAFIAAIVFVLGTSLFLLNFFVNTMVSNLVAVPQINQSSGAVSSLQGLSNTANRFDYIVFAIFIGMVLAMMIFGWLVGGHPIFMFIYFIFWALAVVISTLLANFWETVSTMSVFGTTINNFPITNYLLLNLPIIISVVGFVGIIAMFAKPFFEQNVGQGGM